MALEYPKHNHLSNKACERRLVREEQKMEGVNRRNQNGRSSAVKITTDNLVDNEFPSFAPTEESPHPYSWDPVGAGMGRLGDPVVKCFFAEVSMKWTFSQKNLVGWIIVSGGLGGVRWLMMNVLKMTG